MVSTMQTNTRLYGMTSAATSSPTVNSSESPADCEEPALSEDHERYTPERVRPEESDQLLGVHPGGSSIGNRPGGRPRVGHVGNGTSPDCEFPKQPKGGDPLEPPQGATQLMSDRRRALSEDQIAAASGTPGVGPHPRPWPDDPRLDPDLLEHGDRRNVIDRYRYWTVSAIVADLETSRHSLHIAIQNWEHDFNIGSIVRTANAFNVAGVHIIGRRRWNRRGAMVTDRYLHVEHHSSVTDFAERLRRRLRRPVVWTILMALCRWRPMSYRSGRAWCSAQRALDSPRSSWLSARSWSPSLSTAPPDPSMPVPRRPSRCTTGRSAGPAHAVARSRPQNMFRVVALREGSPYWH